MKKARDLRKKLKQKEEETSEAQQPAETKLRAAATLQDNKKRPMLFQAPKRRRDSYIDPLEYFQKEHLIVKEDKMDEYLFDDDQVIEEEGGEKKEERPKPKGGMMMMGMPMPMGGPHGGGFRINFEEMMKARSKIKKEADKAENKKERPTSVKKRKKSIDDEDEDEPKKRGQNDEQNLYIKLVMARNKYSELSSAKTNVYDKIMKQIEDLRKSGMPPKYLEKVDEFEAKIKIPERLILDPDVQEINNENQYEKIIENPVNLDDIISSLNLAASS